MQVWHRSAKVTHSYASLLHSAGQLEAAIIFYNRQDSSYGDLREDWETQVGQEEASWSLGRTSEVINKKG